MQELRSSNDRISATRLPAASFLLRGLLCACLLVCGCKSNPSASGAANQANGQAGQTASQQSQGILQSDGTYAAAPAANSPGNTSASAGQQPSGQQPASQIQGTRSANPAAAQTLAAGVPAPGSQPAVTAPAVVTVPAGTAIVVRTNGAISTTHDPVGTGFTGELERAIEVHHEVIFAKGAPVSGEVVASKRKGRFAGAGDLALVVTEIDHHHVETSEFVKTDKGEGKRTGAFIGGGGGLGAILGGIAGGGRGALIGGLAGAGAGTAGAATGSRAVILPAESVLTVRLRHSVTR